MTLLTQLVDSVYKSSRFEQVRLLRFCSHCERTVRTSAVKIFPWKVTNNNIQENTVVQIYKITITGLGKEMRRKDHLLASKRGFSPKNERSLFPGFEERSATAPTGPETLENPRLMARCKSPVTQSVQSATQAA